MPASGMKRADRRQTIPLRKSDTEHLFDFFLYKQKLKTLPSERDVTTGVQRVLESTTTTTTSTEANTMSLQVEEQQQFKRTNSYRKATGLSIYDNVEDMAPSPFKMTQDRMFKKEDYDYRKYKTLPPESATLRRVSRRKRKSSEAQMNNNNNNKSTNNNEKSPHHIQRSGSIASSDTDGADEVSIKTIDRKKKSAFQRAKERILQTFTKQKKTDEEKKEKSKAKKSPPSKKKTKRHRGKDGGKAKDDGVVVMDENGHSTSHVTQTRHGNILVRREESMEVKDCVTPSSPCVHSESHTMVTDTRDLSTKSKPTAIARLQSLRRSMRRKFSDASKSPKEENKAGLSSINVSTSGSDQRRRMSRHTSLSSPSSPCPVGHFRQPANTVTKVFEAIISQDAEQDVPQGRLTRSATRGGVNVSVDRSRLQLNGLVPCHPLPHSLPSSGSFSADIETDTHTKYVRSPSGFMDVVTDVHESVHMCPMDVDDVEADCPNDSVDGIEPVAKKGRGSSRRRLLLGTEENSVPFDELTQDEKNKRIESVANRLAVIADNYVTRAESSQSDNECQSPTGHPAGRHLPERLNSIERDLVMELRKEGDRLSETINVPSLIMPIAMQLVKETDQYSRFTNVVESSLGGTVGWHNVAMYFYVTKAAVHMAGAGGAVALRLKDMALQYFSDKFAGWITDRGGWDSVLEETDSELD